MIIQPDDFKNEMLYLEQEYGNGEDEEEFHKLADDIMCEVLNQLGYGEGIEVFRRNPKWYC